MLAVSVWLSETWVERQLNFSVLICVHQVFEHTYVKFYVGGIVVSCHLYWCLFWTSQTAIGKKGRSEAKLGRLSRIFIAREHRMYVQEIQLVHLPNWYLPRTVHNFRPKLDWRFVQRFCGIQQVLFPSCTSQSALMFGTLLAVILTGNCWGH